MDVIGYCGLFCGNCKRFKNGKCIGCLESEKLSWCKIRTCCQGKELAHCARCEEFPDPRKCSVYHSMISRVIEFFSGTDRSVCIACIRDQGEDAFRSMMREKGTMSLSKKERKK